MTETLFKENNEQDTTDVKFDDLVGEGKKWSDPDALAKAKLESDAHISRIEKENAELREAVAKGKTVEEFLREQEELFAKQQKEKVPASNPEEPKPGEPLEPKTVGVKPEDIEKLVSEQLSKREQAQKEQQNLVKVRDTLSEKFGADVGPMWNQMKAANGLTEEQAQAMAKSTPDVVLNLFQAAAPKKEETPNLFGATIDSSKANMKP